TADGRPVALVADLVGAVLAAEPSLPEPWVPGPPVAPEVEPLLGVWWSEGTECVLSWRAGRLEARQPSRPERPPAVFAPEGGDVWRTVYGREAGERLVVVRDASGGVERLHWATYAMTRDPRPFPPPRSAEPPAGD